MAIAAASCGGSSGGPSQTLGNGVWVADPTDDPVSASVDEFITGQFAHGLSNSKPIKHILNPGNPTASPTAIPPFTAPQDPLFDSANDLWVVDGGDNNTTNDGTQQVFEFPIASIRGHNGDILPSFFISTADFLSPQFAIFDSGGNLWVSDTAAIGSIGDTGVTGVGEIFEFTKMQLTATSGPQIPNVTLISDFFNAPLGMVFDSAGDLWVANNATVDDTQPGLIEISAATLATASTDGGVFVVTDTDLTSSFFQTTGGQGAPSLDAPWGLSFDSNKNLWVSNEMPSFVPSASVSGDASKADLQAAAAPSIGQGTVVQFAASVVSAGGTATPTPAVQILPTTPPAGATALATLQDPQGISIDKINPSVIVANDLGPDLARYAIATVGTGGALSPLNFVDGTNTTLGAPTGLITGPIIF